jgi:hypothetical protein
MHPITIDHVRTFLAKRSFRVLILSYILCTTVIALPIGLSYLFTANTENNASLYKWWLYSFLQLYDYELPVVKVDFNSAQIIISAISQILKIILPSILLGAVIFKFFIIPKVFTFRKKCSVFYDLDRQEMVLVVRAYSSTKLIVLDTKFTSIARIPRRRKGTNKRYLENCYLKSDSDNWAIATTHVPRTLYIPLIDGDVIEQGNAKRLFRLQGHEFEHELRLLIVISGKVPELGAEFIEHHWYTLSTDIDWGKFQDIDVSYELSSNSRKWKGWDNFEGTEPSSSKDRGE